MQKDKMFPRFALYGFLKNLRFFEPFLILFFLQVGLSFFQIGILYAIREIITNLLEIPSGFLADIYGRKNSMLFSFSAYIISFLIFSFTSRFGLFVAAMFWFACGEAFRSGTHKALILSHLRLTGRLNERLNYYGHTRAASQAGSALNSLLAAALVFYTGNYRYIFLAAIVPYLLDLINLAGYPAELDEISSIKGQKKQVMKEYFSSFLLIFKHSDNRRVFLNSSIFTGCFTASKDYLQPVIKAWALSLPLLTLYSATRRSAVIIGIVYFFIYMLTVSASAKAVRITAFFKSDKQALNITFMVGALLLLAAGFGSYLKLPLISILALLTLYLFHNYRRPLNVHLLSEVIPPKLMASGLSAETQMTTLITAAFALLLGFLADSFSIAIALAVSGVILAFLYLMAHLNLQK
ncbi:MAG: MFS transporter [Candidatus Cloacimonetes bacterium]|nr:MFS transporter [Candidatus Cloacimonadota bacterium]